MMQASREDDQGRVLFKRQLEAEIIGKEIYWKQIFIKKIVGSSHYYCALNCIAKSLTFYLKSVGMSRLATAVRDQANRVKFATGRTNTKLCYLRAMSAMTLMKPMLRRFWELSIDVNILFNYLLTLSAFSL